MNASSLNKTKKTWALVPIKAFGKAKTRLLPVLNANQCAALAQHMAMDVVAALKSVKNLQGITLLGEQPIVADFARKLECDYQAEASADGLSASLDVAAGDLKIAGVDTLLVLPSDLPTIRAADIDQLLNKHAGGLGVCPARRDGGTNALVISPPGAIEFCFGQNSARRHLEAANVAELKAEQLSCDAFSRDIDTPDDLIWFCQRYSTGSTADYLNKTGICETLLRTDAAAFA